MSKYAVRASILVVALVAPSTRFAYGVDVSGSWALCASIFAGSPSCPSTIGSTLVATGDTFTTTFAVFPDFSFTCNGSGSVDPGSGTMSGTLGNCVAAPGSISGTATDDSMSGSILLELGLCHYTFVGVRACGARDDGVTHTTDGCGTTACSDQGSMCAPRQPLRRFDRPRRALLVDHARQRFETPAASTFGRSR